MTDKRLRDDILAELDWRSGLDSTDIGVLVDDGVVTLTGHVPSYAQRLLAELAVRRVRGVRAVVEQIEVRPLDAESDEDLAHRVLAMLEWDVRLPHEDIQVRVSHGVVTLGGKVQWDYQRRAAAEIVHRLQGVRNVVNQIELQAAVPPTDVRERIEAALERYADVEARNIQVEVTGRKVMLRGLVRSSAEREIVERAAWSAPGVQSVEDELEVAA
jgi:osmotically-inducible protein OsmY